MKKIKKQQTSQGWIPINEILNNGIIKTKNNYLKILKVTPINYNLKSDLEKQAILNSYKIFLKTCDFNFQILIQSSKENLEKNIFIIISKKNSKEQEFNESFELIKNDLKEKYFKIKECLSRCGNSVFEINTKEEILKILNTFFNTRKENNLKNNKEED